MVTFLHNSIIKKPRNQSGVFLEHINIKGHNRVVLAKMVPDKYHYHVQ